MPTVQDIIKSHFVFWQQYVSTPQGQSFVNFYRVETKPVVMILDAETKTKLKEWTGFIEPDLLLDHVTAFVGTAAASSCQACEPATFSVWQPLLTWCAVMSAEELETATKQKKQRIEAQMAMRGSHGTAPIVSAAGGAAAPSTAPAVEASAGMAAERPAATGRALTEDEELAAAIAASLEGADTQGSSSAEQQSGQPSRIDSPVVAAVELQPEPAEGSANVSAMAFRLPSGERVQRRFAGERSLQDAFDYLQIEHGLQPGTYSMVRATSILLICNGTIRPCLRSHLQRK